MRIKYTEELKQFFAETVPGRSNTEVLAIMQKRFGYAITDGQLKAYKKNYKVRSGKRSREGYYSDTFPQEVAEYIKANYQGTGHQEMADKLNAKYGTDYRKQQIKAFYANHHLNCGKTGRFEKGMPGITKGMHFIQTEAQIKTRFHKGHVPYNKLPVGTVLEKDDGYLWKKIADPNRWRQLHLLIYEAANGKVPRNKCVIILDGNRKNTALENLRMVDRSVNLTFNRSNLRCNDAELNNAGLNVAILKTALRKRKRRKNESGNQRSKGNQED